MLTAWLYRGYAAFFVLSGVGSGLIAHHELPLWFALEGTPSLLNQYRFLRAVEAGFGMLLLLLERDFFMPGRVRTAILGSFLAIPTARLVGIALDGLPSPEFLALAVTELGLVAWFLWRGHDVGPWRARHA